MTMSHLSPSKWLRPFSGRMPKPSGENDFETWCLHVDLMFQDGAPVDVQRMEVLESLLPPGSDVAGQINLLILENMWSCWTLLMVCWRCWWSLYQVFEHHQKREKALEYPQRLQVLSRNGISRSSASHQLLEQFKRGCWITKPSCTWS